MRFVECEFTQNNKREGYKKIRTIDYVDLQTRIV